MKQGRRPYWAMGLASLLCARGPGLPGRADSRMRVLIVLAALLGAGAGLAFSSPEIPELKWPGSRSDWIDVTQSPYNADTNGVIDATVALQSALNKLREAGSTKSTVYLPAGTYRITQTLIGGGALHAQVNMVGHGRRTRIVWAGATGGRMYRSDGAAYSIYEGMVWDGQGIAAEGLMHDALAGYETKVIHRNEAFLNFTGAASGTAPDKPDQRYLEGSLFDNCLFINCGTGIQIMQWNDYVITIAGCEFYDCGYGIHNSQGNFYARACHFERSKIADMFNEQFAGGCSARRCTSLDSQAFARFGRDGGSTLDWESPVTLQDCHVSGWKNPAYAVLNEFRGPMLVFDCVFSNAPSTNPPIKLGNRETVQILVHSSNRTTTARLIDSGTSLNQVTEVPPGLRGGSLVSAQQRFFKEKATVPAVVFDAKSYGARGDGTGDDGAALQSCMDAARAHGNGAVAYIPRGLYNVSSTLTMNGSNYSVRGAGWFTWLNWVGNSPSGFVVRVENPDHLALEHLYCTRVQQESTTPARSVMRYDNVYVGTLEWPRKPIPAFEIDNLSAGSEVVITFLHEAMTVFNNCSAANVILNHGNGLPLVVRGAGSRDGLIGVLTSEAYFVVEDNQSLVASDCWYEQGTVPFATLTGAEGQGDGHVTLSAARLNTGSTNELQIANYEGRLTSIASKSDGPPYALVQTGTRPFQAVFAANDYVSSPPTFALATSGVLAVTGCYYTATSTSCVENTMPPSGLSLLASALDDYRELGDMDLALNYGVLPADAVAPAGTPVAWLMSHVGVTNDYAAMEREDPDADGLVNWQEYQAGTDPTNAVSALRLNGPVLDPTAPDAVIVSWPSVSARVYTVQAATNLQTAGFDRILWTNIAATPPLNVLTDRVTTAERRFYRIRLE